MIMIGWKFSCWKDIGWITHYKEQSLSVECLYPPASRCVLACNSCGHYWAQGASHASSAWRSEEGEGFLASTSLLLGVNLDNVEADCLGERSALANGNDVTLLNTGESGGTVSSDVLVSLLESVVLLDVVEVISSYNDGSLHLGRNDDSPIHIIIINIYK